MGWDRNKRKIRGRGAQFTSGVTVDAGGLTASKGGLTISSGVFKLPFLASLTTVAELTNQGISHLTGTSANNYVLGLPAQGALKMLITNSTWALTVTCKTNSYFVHSGAGSTSGSRKAAFDASNEGLTLLGLSTVKWFILSNMNSVTISGT